MILKVLLPKWQHAFNTLFDVCFATSFSKWRYVFVSKGLLPTKFYKEPFKYVSHKMYKAKEKEAVEVKMYQIKAECSCL